MNKKKLVIIYILMAGCLLLSACSEIFREVKVPEENTYEERYDVIDKGPVKGGSVRLFTTPVDTLNPLLTENIYVQDFLGLVFEGLYRLDPEQKPVPVLAESASFSPDGLVLTVKLRDQIKWHDKMPFKADDVVFTINALLDTKNKSIYSKNVQQISQVSASGSNTVVITLKQPYSFILEELTFPILPNHYFLNEKLNDKKSKRNLEPMGTGPYIFASYEPEQSVKLKINEEWWNAAAGNSKNIQTPYISSFEIKIFKNSNEANSAFHARDVDVIPADYSEFRKYIGRTDIILKRYPGKNYEFLSLNMKKGPLEDKGVRNAVNHLLDKIQLIDAVAAGIATPAEIPVLSNSWVHKLVNREENFDSAQIRELMNQSGYSYDADNVRYINKKTKKALSLTLIVNSDNNLRVNTANEIAAQLGKKGIQVKVEKMTWEEVQKRMKAGSYDMALMGYRISSIPDLSFAYSTEGIQSGLNTAGYSNAAADGYLQDILTQTNQEVRSNSYASLLKIILDDTPYIGLYYINDSMMYGKNIRGAVAPYVLNKYEDITQWYIPQ